MEVFGLVDRLRCVLTNVSYFSSYSSLKNTEVVRICRIFLRLTWQYRCDKAIWVYAPVCEFSSLLSQFHHTSLQAFQIHDLLTCTAQKYKVCCASLSQEQRIHPPHLLQVIFDAGSHVILVYHLVLGPTRNSSSIPRKPRNCILCVNGQKRS